MHASVIISFPEFAEFNESSAPFRKNSTVDIRDCTMETELGKMFKHYNVVLLSSFMMNTAYQAKY